MQAIWYDEKCTSCSDDLYLALIDFQQSSILLTWCNILIFTINEKYEEAPLCASVGLLFFLSIGKNDEYLGRPDQFQRHTDIGNGSSDQGSNMKTLHNLVAVSIEHVVVHVPRSEPQRASILEVSDLICPFEGGRLTPPCGL